MKRIKFKDLIAKLDKEAIIIGNREVEVTKAEPIDSAGSTSISWIKPGIKNIEKLIERSIAGIIICPKINLELISDDVKSNKLIIIVDNPKLTFIRIIDFFSSKPKSSIHESAIIDKMTNIGKNVYIGPNTIIKKSVIGDNCTIYGNCTIYENTIIGNEVTINSGTVIGADGFGYSKNDKGEMIKFPHIGGVIIGHNVEIGTNTSIDRGTLGNTIIGNGVKIDNLTHIAHNVQIEENAVIIANSMIGGSVKIGREAWIAPSVSIINGITIGDYVTVGIGSLVTKNIANNETWAGSPARPIDELKKLNKKIKKL